MANLEDAFRYAAGEVADIKAQPSSHYWWLYGTIRAKNENGTLDVAVDGVTIQQVKATVSCMTASVGDRVIVLKAGPLMTCVDVIATSDKVATPADSIEGTISADNLPVGSTSQRGIMQVGYGLGVEDGLLSADKADLTNMLFVCDRISADLNTATPGVWMYNTDTASSPSEWGVCLVLWSEVDGQANADWKFQLAFPTAGDPKWRRNINRQGWSNWWTMPTN
jgi:hypothetical protein|nr:MAG TPA: hypothetical protein [Caudoviricetes sp.]